MKEFIDIDTSQTEGSSLLQTPIRLCMHVRGVVRLDHRVMREATALRDAGFAVTILDFEDDLTRPVEEDLGGIHVKHIMKPNWLLPARSRVEHLIKSTQKLVYTTKQLIRMPADIYHAHDDNALAACYVAARWHRKLLIFDAHEFPLNSLSDKRRSWLSALFINLFTRMIRNCAGIITVSSPIAQEICYLYHIPQVSLIRNLPVYQALPKSNRLRQHLGLSPSVKVALFQGNIDPNRGLDKLVHTAKFLDRDIVVVMMGKGVGVTPSELEALAESEGVTDRIRIIPPVPYEELLNWTASADIGLIVSSPDYSLNVRMSLPNKLFEYLMAGLPVLSSQLPAVAEVINTYDVGQVVSSLAPTEIAAAINAMLEDQAALERMHRNALEAAQHEFYWEKEQLQLLQLYDEILKMQNVKLKV
jgi:glycosyltransferase involved in cell wall biosynthesis